MKCPKCKAAIGLHHTVNLMGGYDGGGRRCQEGQSCVICGHWVEAVHVVKPDIPPASRHWNKSPAFIAACHERHAARSLRPHILDHLSAIKFWMFNGDGVQKCCDKLAAKGVTITRSALASHLKAIAEGNK